MKPCDSSKRSTDTSHIKGASPFSDEQIRAAMAAADDTPVQDQDNPPTSDDDWRGAVVSRSAKELNAKLSARRSRGKQKAPTKMATSLRLSPTVVGYFKASGRGWQSRINAVLEAYVKEHEK